MIKSMDKFLFLDSDGDGSKAMEDIFRHNEGRGVEDEWVMLFFRGGVG